MDLAPVQGAGTIVIWRRPGRQREGRSDKKAPARRSSSCSLGSPAKVHPLAPLVFLMIWILPVPKGRSGLFLIFGHSRAVSARLARRTGGFGFEFFRPRFGGLPDGGCEMRQCVGHGECRTRDPLDHRRELFWAHPQRGGFRTAAIAVTAITIVTRRCHCDHPARALPMPRRPCRDGPSASRPATARSLTIARVCAAHRHEIAALALTLGILCFAVVTAILLVRARAAARRDRGCGA